MDEHFSLRLCGLAREKSRKSPPEAQRPRGSLPYDPDSVSQNPRGIVHFCRRQASAGQVPGGYLLGESNPKRVCKALSDDSELYPNHRAIAHLKFFGEIGHGSQVFQRKTGYFGFEIEQSISFLRANRLEIRYYHEVRDCSNPNQVPPPIGDSINDRGTVAVLRRSSRVRDPAAQRGV